MVTWKQCDALSGMLHLQLGQPGDTQARQEPSAKRLWPHPLERITATDGKRDCS